MNYPNNEPYSFKEFKLGMYYSNFNAPDQKIENYGKYAKSVHFPSTIAGIRCNPFCWFEDYGTGLQLKSISLFVGELKMSQFYIVRPSLIEKFGTPTRRIEYTKRNGFGETFETETLIWENEFSRIEAEEMGNNGKYSEIKFEHTALGNSLWKLPSDRSINDI